jgi:hypothetical protein
MYTALRSEKGYRGERIQRSFLYNVSVPKEGT